MRDNTKTMRAPSLVAGGVIAAAALAAAPVHAEGLLQWQDESVVALGAEIYGTFCASCHGADLEGQADWQIRRADGRLPAPPHDESGHTWHHPDEILIAITTLGTAALVGGDYQSDMIGFGDVLDADEIIAVLSYIKSTWPAEVSAIHDEINARHAAAR